MLDYYQTGQRIRKVRKAQGLSQEQLSEMVGISATHMSHIETGNTKLSLPVLADLAAALHVTTDDLLFGPTEGQKPAAVREMQDILDACSPREAKILLEILRTAKTAMDQYQE